MGIFDDAHVTILVADYVGIDGGQKANVLGAGFMATMAGPGGMTAPQYVLVMVDLPAKHAGTEFALSLELRDDSSGGAVKLVGPHGQSEALRVQMVVKGERVQPTQVVYLPPDLQVRVQHVMGFPNGIPLEAGHSFTWRLEIDGQHRKGWTCSFHVLGPAPSPVFGGPSSPTDLPPLSPPDYL